MYTAICDFFKTASEREYTVKMSGLKCGGCTTIMLTIGIWTGVMSLIYNNVVLPSVGDDKSPPNAALVALLPIVLAMLTGFAAVYCASANAGKAAENYDEGRRLTDSNPGL